MDGDGWEPVVARAAEAELGEGPSWDAATSTLVWVDIEAKLLHGTVEAGDWEVALPVVPGAVVPHAGGGYVLAGELGFFLIDPAAGTCEQIVSVAEHESDPTARFNDGKCDSAGRFWAGTCLLGPDSAPTGHLYRLDPDGTVRLVVDGVRASNGIAWSPDDRTMYYIDSARHSVDAFDFDAGTGAIERRRPLVEVPDERCVPDGMTTDAEGALWVAVWGSSEVRRYHPDGTLDRRVQFPVSRPSSCVFGGPDLRTLYVTSAWYRMSEARRAREPLAGHLFALTPGVSGAPTFTFGSSAPA